MIYVYFFIKRVVRLSENSVRFENLTGTDFQKAQILLDFLSHSLRYCMYLILVFYGGYHYIILPHHMQFHISLINTIYHAMAARTYHIPCEACQAIPCLTPCPPSHFIYHAMPARPYHKPCHACQAKPYTMQGTPSHITYHAITFQAIPYTMSCPPGDIIYHAISR